MSEQWNNPSEPTHWIRSNSGILAGVCQSFGERFSIEPWIVRAIWVALVLFMGTGLFFYLVLWTALPRQDDYHALSRPMFLGVCSKIAIKWNWDIGLTRAACLLLMASSLGLSLVVYALVHFFLPPKNSEKVIFK